MILRTVIGLIFLSASSAAQPGYFTYQTWLAMSEGQRAVYMAGAYDSLITFVQDEQSMRNVKHYKNCIAEAQMNNFQLAANIVDFAKDEPKLQVGSPQGATINYLISACGEPPTK
jgi:hypothetical protein